MENKELVARLMVQSEEWFDLIGMVQDSGWSREKFNEWLVKKAFRNTGLAVELAREIADEREWVRYDDHSAAIQYQKDRHNETAEAAEGWMRKAESLALEVKSCKET